jgi:autotransporter-associated beta strand protein
MNADQGYDVDIGSLEGDGIVKLGGKTLSVGRNNLDTTFAGQITSFHAGNNVNVSSPGTIKENVEQGCDPTGGPGLVKTGTGTLTLTGANAYGGTTTVTDGTLIVNSTSRSATGISSVNVEAGTLGGKGPVDGAVTVGTGSGTGAVLAPSVGINQPVTLTLNATLIFKADSTYRYKLNINNARADQVIANGVTIESGAQFSLQLVGTRRLPVGTIFTAISNTSANAISGTFANLPDGSTFTVGGNNFQVSYSGGDGNDLALTVVP